ncbi:cytochrome P450 [Arthrobacter rhombi]|uniref:cytochrome P450 n=1 Tax=Arthrobacter rhombi TaxID=71253 RepID=UPI003F91FF4B
MKTADYFTVTDPQQVREVLERTTEFLPTNALTAVEPLGPEALRVLAQVGFALPPVLASAVGDEHLRVRKLVARFFSPAKVAAVADRVASLTREQAAEARSTLEKGSPGDLGERVGGIPAQIMWKLIGVSGPPQESLRRWSRDSLELFWGWPGTGRQVELAHGAAEFYAWLKQAVTASVGSENLFGVLHAAGLGGRQICSLGYFLVIAGQETTALLINTVLYRALADPGAWADCAGTDGLAASKRLVRRVLATESSVPTWRRRTVEGAMLGGRQLPAGAEILLELTGHHDPETVADGGAGYGLAFGHGLHRCLGARLAELEAGLVLHEVASTLPDAVPSGPEPEWLRLLSFQAPRRVQARIDGGT